MNHTTVLVIAVLLSLSACNEAQRGNDSSRNEDRNEAAAESNADKFDGKTQRDARFVFEVVESNYHEVKLAELGGQRAKHPDVRRIAQTLVTDHTSSLNELKTIAQAKAISVPVQESDDGRKNLESLAGQNDSDFTKSWCKEMIDLHVANIKKFEDRLEETEDPELREFINKTLPVLKKHHEALKASEERLSQTRKR